MEHALTFREWDDPKGYGDGLDDVYDCTCGRTFQANGDIVDAFDHGRETAPKPRTPVVLAEVSEGMMLTTTVIRGDVEIIDVDWSTFVLDADNDATVEEIDAILDQIERLGVGQYRPKTHVGMPATVRQLRAARTAYIKAHGVRA